ncbi:MAG TPA: ribonuclease PH [Blastocatellia bacterium]|nr:ribonuclease PH [Blastocatellia bacterium]
MTNYKPTEPSSLLAAPRRDGRRPADLRPVKMTTGYTKYAEGSVLVEIGQTRIICTATVEERVPQFLKGKGQGWVTAEYAMLPRATEVRTQREIGRGGPSGRTHEIQRLIGRSLRSVIEMTALGERTLTIDCDVIQADGGTRTASITGGFVAMALALNKLRESGKFDRPVLRDYIAAVSVGIVGQRVLLDLDYSEDSAAEVDMNIVRTGDGRFVEIQGTAETEAFSRAQMDEMISAAESGVDRLITSQRETIVQALGGKNLGVMIDEASRSKINWKENTP